MDYRQNRIPRQHGERRAGHVLAIVLISVTAHFTWTIVACAALGIGTAPLWPCVITGTTEVAGDEAKGTIMSVVHMAWLSGTGLGPVAINFVIRDSNYGPAFRLLLGCMTAVVLVSLLLPKRGHGPANKGAPAENAALAGKTRPSHKSERPLLERAGNYMREVRRSLNVSPLLFPAMFLQTFALGILSPILTLYARQELALTPRQYSLFLVAGGAVTVLLLIPVGKLVDRIGTKLFLTVGFALGAATVAAFTYTKSLYVVYGFVTAVGIAYALIIPAWNALIAAAIPKEKRGAVWGFFLTIEGLGTVIGPIVSGKLWDVYGPHVPFLTSGAVLALLCVLQLLLEQNKARALAA
ncbi:MFS transporter [Gordoniibacillus kamchatkensis]|uniref:MFS transporter n=1 Tax=Gordoniibacillus kamchatkensis TaxID=1590651 RepID=UPI001E39766D|nr:MFS transporter [Paenibacillus sp. VKM B-2647]